MNKNRIVLGKGFLYETAGGGFGLSDDKFRGSGPEPFAYGVNFGLMKSVPMELFHSKVKYRVILEKA